MLFRSLGQLASRNTHLSLTPHMVPPCTYIRPNAPTPRSQPRKPKVHVPALTPSSSQTQSSQSTPNPPRTKTNMTNSGASSSKPVLPQRPKFQSDWIAPNAHLSKIGSGSLKRKRSTVEETDPVKANFVKTLGLDRKGKSVSGSLVIGSRKKLSLE